MKNIPERFRALIEFAVTEGWQVRQTKNGRITLTKPGYATIYTGAATKTRLTTLVSEGNRHG